MEVGEAYGSWTILADSGKRTKNRETVWFCECLCGKRREVSAKVLKNHLKPRTCGCIRKISAERRFHSLYEKSDGCWEWKGTLNNGGYGKWKALNASRQAWIYAYGNIKKGRQVCHKCDNRRCVNPSHLFIGTICQNQLDKVYKNRQAKGSKIGNSILSEAMVLDMRKMRISGSGYAEIAKTFGVSWWLARSICKNRQWKHVGLGNESAAVPQNRPKQRGSEVHSAKLTESDVVQIKKWLDEGMIVKNIQQKVGCSLGAIYDIKQKRTWNHL